MRYIVNLRRLLTADFEAALAGIPKHTSILDASHNFLGLRKLHELKSFYYAIPAAVTSLSLKGNQLYAINRQGSSIYYSMQHFPSSILELVIADNDLGLTTGEVLRSLDNKKVQRLDLQGNQLWDLTGNELGESLSFLPDSVRDLDLRNNHQQESSPTRRGRLSSAQVTEIYNVIASSNVTSLRMDPGLMDQDDVVKFQKQLRMNQDEQRASYKCFAGFSSIHPRFFSLSTADSRIQSADTPEASPPQFDNF